MDNAEHHHRVRRKKRVSFDDPLAVSEEDTKNEQELFVAKKNEDEARNSQHESYIPHKPKKMKGAADNVNGLGDILGMKNDTTPVDSPEPDTETLATETSYEVGDDDEGMTEAYGDQGPEPMEDEAAAAAAAAADEHEQKWLDFVEEKRARGEVKNSCQGLDMFLQGRERWESANDALEQELKKFEEGMNNAVDIICGKVIASIQHSRHTRLEELSGECNGLLTSNQERRNEMLKSLGDANQVWKATFKKLVSRTLHRDIGEEEEEDNGIQNIITDGTAGSQEETETSYRTTDQRLQDAHACFKRRVGLTVQDMKEKIRLMIDDIVNIHRDQAEIVDSFDEAIRQGMMHNHERGILYTKKLQEANESRQAFYAQLLQQVTTKGSSNADKST